MTDQTNFDGIWEAHIYAPDEEMTVHASTAVDQNEDEHVATRTGDTRLLALTEGGIDVEDQEPPSEDNPFVFQANREVSMDRTITYSHEVAIGYYLHLLEIHDLDEDACVQGLHDRAEDTGLPMDRYDEWSASLSPGGRRVRLMDLAEWRAHDGNDWAAEPYLDTGQWRAKNLSETGRKFGERVWRHLDPNPQQCYRNAQQTAIQHAENHRVEYVEGLALDKHAAQVSRHAWVEFGGQVVEVTWPWHDIGGDDAVYFGVSFDAEEVEETFERRDGGSQLILDDDETTRLTEARSR